MTIFVYIFRNSSQDGDGGAANDASNQEYVYSQIKKFQVGTIKIIKYNAVRIIILVFYMSDWNISRYSLKVLQSGAL